MGLIKPWHVRHGAHKTAALSAHVFATTEAAKATIARARRLVKHPHKVNNPLPPHLVTESLHTTGDCLASNLPLPGIYRPCLYGPGVGGSTMSYTTALPEVFLWLLCARLGRWGNFSHPAFPSQTYNYNFRNPRDDGEDTDNDDIPLTVPTTTKAVKAPKATAAARTAAKAATKAAKVATAAVTAAAVKAAKTALVKSRAHVVYSPTCEACTKVIPASGGDLVHFCTECPNIHLVTLRNAIFGNGHWARLISPVIDGLYHALKLTTPVNVTEAIHNLNFMSPEGIFITRRVLLSAPWSTAMARPDWLLARLLALQFERDMPDGQARHLADPWATTAHYILTSICTKWWEYTPLATQLTLHNAGHRIQALEVNI